MKTIKSFAVLCFVGLGLGACSSLPDVPTGPEGYNVVAASDNPRPEWMHGLGPWSEKKQNKDAVWFVASSPLENSLQGAKHDAFIRAQRKAAERIGDQNWSLVKNAVTRHLRPSHQMVQRMHDATTTQIRQAAQGWLVGAEDYQYYWVEYQPKHKNRVEPSQRTLYRAWAVTRYSEPNWECSRKNSLKMIPMIAANLGGTFGYHKFDAKKFRAVLSDITNKNLALIPDNVCAGG